MQLVDTRPGAWPSIGAGRFAAGIRSDSSAGCRLALLGLPDDTGVRLNAGRPGAAEGPAAFRAALARYGTSWDALGGRALDSPLFDAGDVVVAPGGTEEALFETHARVERALRQIHELGMLPICIGGGHDLTLPSVMALAKHAGTPVSGVNLDAHLDVRERVGSGMPFRRLIENGALEPRRFAEIGLGRYVNEQRDLDWLSSRGADLVFADELLRSHASAKGWIDAAFGGSRVGFVSIDLDALDGAAAPGVSAHNPVGLGAAVAAELAEAAGADPRVRHFDVMELCPPHDADGRTARVAAHLFLAFVSGFGVRPA